MFMMTTDRRCPRCDRVLPLTTEHWYMRERKNADGTTGRTTTAYCKPCTIEYNGMSRRRRAVFKSLPADQRARIATSVVGRCDICGRVKMPHNRRRFDGGLACFACVELYDECNRNVVIARAKWAYFFAHNRHEEQLNRVWRADRPRRPDHDHVTCVWKEDAWKAVLAYLARGNGAG